MQAPCHFSILRVIVLFGLAMILGIPGSLTSLAATDEPLPGETSLALSETSRVVSAANAFVAMLDEKQRTRLLFAFSDEKQRARWSNFPTGFVPRGGLSLRELSEAQRAAALALVSSALSQKGFEKVQQIMEADDVFKATNHGPPPFGKPGDGAQDHPPFDKGKDGNHGPPPFGPAKDGKPGEAMFGKDLYYVSILGTPSEKDPWMLQFGGHHLALNITIAGEHGVLTPTLTGAQPGTYTANGKTVRPLGQENDEGFALLNALDEARRKQAILNYRVADLVLGPGHDGETIQPEGLKASAMNERQRTMLLDLISEWVGIVNDSFVSERMREIKTGLDDTWFAWSGPTTHEPGKNGTAYYRIQGPKLVIEFSPQGVGGDPTMHVHTIYRDPTNGYGRAFTAK